MLRRFKYKFDAGPVATQEELLGNWEEGNCRKALQTYFLSARNIFLSPADVLCPRLYYETGKFIFTKDEAINFDLLSNGDIIFAEKIGGKAKTKTGEEYIISLHTAIYTSEPGREVWQSTYIDGGSCYWSLRRFLDFYKPVAVKRL